MLAQSFKTADELGLSDAQKGALMKVLVLLETGRLQHREMIGDADSADEPTFCENFNMRWWTADHPCGTVACIGGTAELVGNVKFDGWIMNAGLMGLFWPRPMTETQICKITPAQAAIALRSYLTTGNAHWELAVA